MSKKETIGYYKRKLLDVTFMLLRRGLYEYTAGHTSLRIPGTDTILIPGHIHPERRTIDSLKEEDISIMDLDGKLVEGVLSPPGERFIHTEIYKVRKDVGAVAHIHPKVATALSVSGKEILPLTVHSCIFHPKVPIYPYPGDINTPEMAKELADLLGNGCAVVQQGHGATVVGGDVEQACVTAMLLEDSAESQMIAMAAGTPKVLPERYLEKKFTIGTEDWEFFGNPWVYYYDKYIKRNR